jgi:hypothetical protein
MASSMKHTSTVRIRKLRKRGKANKSARNAAGTTLSPEQLFAVKG